MTDNNVLNFAALGGTAPVVPQPVFDPRSLHVAPNFRRAFQILPNS